jgi:hypothetical protein
VRVSIESGDRSQFARAVRSVRATEPARTGLHLSTIIHDIQQRHERAARRTPIPDSTMLVFQQLGNVIEDVIADAMMARFPGWVKPEPRQSPEGIWCSPDGYSPRINCIDEVKATWKSYKDFLTVRSLHGNRFALQDVLGSGDSYTLADESEKCFYYRLQVLAYCHVWGATRCRLHVCFLNGSYQPPFPMPITFVLKPEPGEIEAMWNLLVNHAKDRNLLPCQPPAQPTVV